MSVAGTSVDAFAYEGRVGNAGYRETPLPFHHRHRNQINRSR